MEKPRFLIIGIDGADRAIVERLMGEGLLPRLKGIAERGAWGGVRSTIPPMTPPAWTTMTTGKNSGRHGVFDFLPMTIDAVPTPIASRRRCTTVWRALSDRGWRVGTFNLPGTYPPEELSAFQVSGFDAPGFGPEMAKPEGIFEILRDGMGEYDLFAPSLQAPEGDEEATERHARLPVLGARTLLAARPCDVVMVSFQVVDWTQHGHLGREMAPGDVADLPADGKVARAYRKVDAYLGELIDEWAGDDTTVAVISDHGGASADTLVNLEKLFLDRGLLAYGVAESEKAGAVEASRSRARTALRWWGAIKRRAPWAAKLLGGLARGARGRLTAYQSSLQVDWSRTRAAAWGDGQIKLNPGRQDGADEVPKGEREALAAEVTDLLLSLRDPLTGEAVYGEVLRGGDVYVGPLVAEGADLIAIPRDTRYFSVSARSGGPTLPMLDLQQEAIVKLSPPWGVHSPVGILFLSGPGVKAGSGLDGATLADFVPTLLYLMGEAIPGDMDGRLLAEALAPATLEARPPKRCDPWPEPGEEKERGGYTGPEQEAVEKRLKDLGYL